MIRTKEPRKFSGSLPPFLGRGLVLVISLLSISYADEYGRLLGTDRYGTPLGQVNHWGNGDGRFLYPPNRNPGRDKAKYLCGPVNSIRWEILREGVEDYEYFWLLEKAVREAPPEKKALAEKGRGLLRIPQRIFRSGRDHTKEARVLLEYRSRLADILERLL